MSDESGDGSVENEDELIASLQGRIIALETLVTGLLTGQAMQVAKSSNLSLAEAVARSRHAVISTMQNLERPSGEYADRVWEAAGRSLTHIYDNIAMRAQSIEGES